MITKEYLLTLFDYDRKRGVFIWKYHWRKEIASRLVGKIAGAFDGDGYRVIRLNKKGYRVHHLVWFIEKGYWPKEIDHKNGVVDDNQISNLREVSRRQNQQNRKQHRKGKLVGTTKRKTGWQSRIEHQGYVHELGIYPTELLAHRAYVNKLKEFDNEP